jgi:hypothetical protein
MDCVRAEVVGWVDEDWPGWVEVHLNEADGTVVSLIDKVPVLDCEGRLAPGIDLPAELEIPCDVLDLAVDQAGIRSAIIRLHFNIGDRNGRTVVNVEASTLASRA